MYGLIPYSGYVLLRKYGLKSISYFCGGITITILSFFAGIRDLSIGTDVRFYMYPSFQYASVYSSFQDYWHVYNFEWLYAVLSYFTEKVTQNEFIFFGLLMALIVLFFLLYVNDNIDEISSITAFFLFMLSFFNASLNYSRQMIAVSIILFSYRYIKRNDFIKFGVCLIGAVLFHKTGIVGLIIPAIYNMDRWKPRARLGFNAGMVTLFMLCLMMYDKILGFAINHGLGSKYAVHLTSGLHISFSFVLFHIIVLAISVVLIKYADIFNKEKHFFYELCIVDFCFVLVSFLSDTAYRIELYSFIFIVCLIIPRCIRKFSKTLYIRILLSEIIIVLFAAYWYVSIVLLNIGQTYPYTSSFLRIFN
ncbi:EpsG family protein [Levilactobacillus spicheri]|nr:EpsG family protein [Levilactobacillus spicheri]